MKQIHFSTIWQVVDEKNKSPFWQNRETGEKVKYRDKENLSDFLRRYENGDFEVIHEAFNLSEWIEHQKALNSQLTELAEDPESDDFQALLESQGQAWELLSEMVAICKIVYTN